MSYILNVISLVSSSLHYYNGFFPSIKISCPEYWHEPPISSYQISSCSVKSEPYYDWAKHKSDPNIPLLKIKQTIMLNSHHTGLLLVPQMRCSFPGQGLCPFPFICKECFPLFAAKFRHHPSMVNQSKSHFLQVSLSSWFLNKALQLCAPRPLLPRHLSHSLKPPILLQYVNYDSYLLQCLLPESWTLDA